MTQQQRARRHTGSARTYLYSHVRDKDRREGKYIPDFVDLPNEQ